MDMWLILGMLISLMIMVVGLALEAIGWFKLAMWRISQEPINFKKFLDFQGLMLGVILVLTAEGIAFNSLMPFDNTYMPRDVTLGSLSYLTGIVALFLISKEWVRVDGETGIENKKVEYLELKRMDISMIGLIVSVFSFISYLILWWSS